MATDTYRLIFQGRQVGAIGVMHTCAVTVEADDQQAAELKLYDTHEHIMGLQVRRIVTGAPE